MSETRWTEADARAFVAAIANSPRYEQTAALAQRLAREADRAIAERDVLKGALREIADAEFMWWADADSILDVLKSKARAALEATGADHPSTAAEPRPEPEARAPQ